MPKRSEFENSVRRMVRQEIASMLRASLKPETRPRGPYKKKAAPHRRKRGPVKGSDT